MGFEIHHLFMILMVGSLMLARVECVRFDLESGHAKCISEDIKAHAMSVGKYHIVNPNEPHPLPHSHKITVGVTSPSGNSFHRSDNVSEGNFSFYGREPGDYMACFFTSDHKSSATFTIDFDWKSGVIAKDWSNVAKKGSVESMEIELKKMLDSVQSIHDEMLYLRERQQEMRELNKTTHNKMGWLSFLSLGVCLSVAGLQFWHLKKFFVKKKLI